MFLNSFGISCDNDISLSGRPLALKRCFENIIQNGLTYGENVKVEVKKGNKWKRVSFESYDPTFDGSAFIDDSYGGRDVYFTDQLFNNSQKKFDIELDVDYQIDSIKLNLFTISESYYNYHVSRKLQNRNENNPLNDLLGAEPVVVYNNINNGFGVFGVRVKNDSIIPVIY